MVVKDVPSDSVVVRILGHVTNKKTSTRLKNPDLNHDKLPDMIEQQIEKLFQRLDKLETRRDNPSN